MNLEETPLVTEWEWHFLNRECISHIFITKNTSVQSYKEIHLLERGQEEGNVVSMVVAVPYHLWGEQHFKLHTYTHAQWSSVNSEEGQPSQANINALTSQMILADSTPVSWDYWQQRSDITQPAGTTTRQACWQI